MTKNKQIKMTIQKTKERRELLLCRVFEIKIINGKLSKIKKSHLDSLYREAKWLRNSELAKGDIKLLDRNAKTATVKVGKIFEVRELTHLSSQMKQDIVDQIKTDISNLSKSKKKGNKVGKLKFKSYCNSIPLRQYGNTYRINFDNNTISIQGFRKPFKVRGLKQIPKDAEIANAKLTRKPSGYYFHITTYIEPKANITGKSCGIDFGIENNLTLSTGKTYNINIPETKGVKLASKRLNKAYVKNGKKKTKNHKKRVNKLRKAYERQTNKKEDLANKTVHDLLINYDTVAIQNEMIANWHKGLFGRQVQYSAMGTIKKKLKNSSKVLVVPKSFPSTQRCPICGKDTKHPITKRDYTCQYCGYYHPSRDVKSAEMILTKALETP